MMKNLPINLPLGNCMKLIEARHGYMLINKFDSYIGKSIEHYGEWGEDEVKLFTNLCGPGDRIIEVGSNIGTHTLPLAKMVGPAGRVYAFEPQRIIHTNLCANISLNELTNVHVYHLAVGDKTKTVYIPKINYNTENNFGGIRVSEKPTGEAVSQIRLDELMSLPSLRLLKVDAEDMELMVFMGATNLIKKHQPYLYFENNPGSALQVELNQFVMNMGYKLYWHITPLFNPENYRKNTTNVFNGYASFNVFGIPVHYEEPAAHFKLKSIVNPGDAP